MMHNHFTRIVARAIIFNETFDKIIMTWSEGYDYWALPGGGLEDEDKGSIVKGLIREVKEETNLDITEDTIAFAQAREFHPEVGTGDNGPRPETWYEFHFVAQVNEDDFDPSHIDTDPYGTPEEVEKGHWKSFDELKDALVYPNYLQTIPWSYFKNLLENPIGMFSTEYETGYREMMEKKRKQESS